MVFPNKDFNEVFNTLEEEMGKLGYVLPTKNMLTTGTVLVEANLLYNKG